MRFTLGVFNGSSSVGSRFMARGLAIAVGFLPLILASTAHATGAAQSSDFESYAIATGESTNVFVDILSYVAFITGVILSALGVQEMRKHVENPNVPLKHPLTKLGFGGMLLSFPYITSLFSDTMGGAEFSPFNIVRRNAFTFGGAATNKSGIGGIIVEGTNNMTVLINVAAYAAFVIGVYFTFRGIQMLRAHIDNPGNAPLPESLKRMGVGGALLSFPVIVNIIYETFGATGGAFKNSGWSSTAAGSGLDGMMVRFIGDISNTGFFAIEAFCYISGILMILFAMQRLVKSAQDGPRGPLGFGTIVMFIVSALLLSFPSLLTSLDSSLFGGATAKTNVSFMSLSGSVNAAQVQNAKNVFSAVLAFMAVIGFLSVVRGLFILKAFADGNGQVSMMSVATHLVAGALAMNLGGLINALQSSLGLTDFAVTFS